MMKKQPEIYIPKRMVFSLFQGLKERKFDDQWLKTGKTKYISIGSIFGIEVKRNETYFINLAKNSKNELKNVEYATLDGEQYFLHVVLHDAEDVYIPIR